MQESPDHFVIYCAGQSGCVTNMQKKHPAGGNLYIEADPQPLVGSFGLQNFRNQIIDCFHLSPIQRRDSSPK
jgi:hypothetical protein